MCPETSFVLQQHVTGLWGVCASVFACARAFMCACTCMCACMRARMCAYMCVHEQCLQLRVDREGCVVGMHTVSV